MTRKEREELNELSLKVLGTTSRWQKILANAMVFDSLDETGKKVFRRYSVEELKTKLQEQLNKTNPASMPTVTSEGEVTNV